jgi:predicted nucleotidyltransferase
VTERQPQHRATIDNLATALEVDDSILALLLTGSIAHGFETADSDVDVAAVVSTERYRDLAVNGSLTFLNFDVATYEGGFVDGKYIDLAFMRRVAEAGSEPARFAFADAEVLFARVDGLDDLLASIVRYPIEGRDDRVDRFVAQLMAWQWYFDQGVDKDSRYLVTLATHKIALFACRIVLARNELLYPYHKWVMRVTESAADRPVDLIAAIESLLAEPTREGAVSLCESVFAHYDLDADRVRRGWGEWFLRDNELTWMTGDAPIDDL